MSNANGAVTLGREMRVRLSPQHMTSLQGLARVHGWGSQTEFAEALLSDAIERAARNTGFSHFLSVIQGAWCA